MNLKEAKDKAIKLIAEYSNNGNIISATANADYTLRMNDLANAAQLEIATVKKIHAAYQISQNPIINQLGLLQGFDMVQHLNTDLTNTVARGSQAYYFEVDRQAIIYIEEETTPNVWTVLSTITVPVDTSSFTRFKGLITPSSLSNLVRIRFSGNYPYNIRNRSLYAYTFPTANDVPDYRPYVKYDMPVDFMELKKVIRESDERQYLVTSDYRWESRRTLVVNYYLSGSFRIEYYRYPMTIDITTDDNYLFEVDPEACEAIPYYIAAHVSMDEPQKQNMVSYYLNIYQSKLANMSSSSINNANITQNQMGW